MNAEHMSFELDENKKEYFKNCKYIARAPASIFLEGNRFSRKAKLLPIPRYAYAGVERGDYDAFRYEEHSDVSLKEEEYLYAPSGMNEEERKMVRGETPISSWYHDRVFYYHLILNERYKHTLVWWEAFKRAWKEKKDNDVDMKEVEKNYQKMLPEFKDYFKIKVWSDITSNIGLNESAAIATAAGMAFYLETKRNEESKATTAGKLRNIIRNLNEQALTDEDFTGTFLYALALDFCTNGAGVFSSLMGIPNKQEILDYEFLAYDELKKFYQPYSPSLIREMEEYGAASYSKDSKISREEKGRRAERYFKKLDDYNEYVKSKGVYAYWDQCLNLHSKVGEGIPLYKWYYSKFIQTESNEPASLLIMRRKDNDKEARPLADSKFKYYQISPLSFAIFSDSNTLALCKANPKRYVFGNEKSESYEKVKTLFYTVYNSREEFWDTEGLKVIELKKLLETKKTEDERADLNFEGRKIRIGSKAESRYQQPFELLEYFMNKGRDVHWVESITIFDEWRNIRNDIYKLKSIFGLVISKLKGPSGIFLENKLDLDILDREDGSYVLNGLENCCSNIINATTLYEDALSLYKNNSFEESKNKIIEALKNYPRHIPSICLLIRLLPRTEISGNIKDNVRRTLQRKIAVLEKSIKTAEHYINCLEDKNWCDNWEDEKARKEFGVEIEIFHSNLEAELEDLKENFDNFNKWLAGKNISFGKDIEYEEIKKSIEERNFIELFKKNAIRYILGIIEAILYREIYGDLKRRVYQNIRSSQRKKALEELEATKRKEAEKLLEEILLNCKLDYSKASTFSSLKRYLIKVAKWVIRDSAKETGLTPGEKRHLREFYDIEKELEFEFKKKGIRQEPTDEDRFDRLKEKKKVGSEYCGYIEDLKKKGFKSIYRDEVINNYSEEIRKVMERRKWLKLFK